MQHRRKYTSQYKEDVVTMWEKRGNHITTTMLELQLGLPMGTIQRWLQRKRWLERREKKARTPADS